MSLSSSIRSPLLLSNRLEHAILAHADGGSRQARQRKRRGKMDQQKALAVFGDFKIRRLYDEKSEIWYFSVVDIVAALLQRPDYQAARKYWKVLKGRLAKEGSELVTNCYQLKFETGI